MANLKPLTRASDTVLDISARQVRISMDQLAPRFFFSVHNLALNERISAQVRTVPIFLP